MANDVLISLTQPAAPPRVAARFWREPWIVALLILIVINAALAITNTAPVALRQLWHWAPALLLGLGLNVGVSALAMILGVMLGLVVGALSVSPSNGLRRATRLYVLVFRNSPILVLIYFTTYVFPFEIDIRSLSIPFPDWIKVVIALALPASAFVAEIFRGAIQSIPAAQWEAAQSLAFKRREIFLRIVLPQCLRRMLPSLVNLNATITMSSALASLVGLHDLVDVATIASESVARTDFTILAYLAMLLLFFAYCYPIARWTRYLEKRHGRY